MLLLVTCPIGFDGFNIGIAFELYCIACCFILLNSLESCVNVDAQDSRVDSVENLNGTIQDPGPDGNPATYDQEPNNLPQSPLWTYINADGREVQNPTAYKEIPPNASAICNNGEYSFSKRRCGTCSGNGGVKQWLKDLPKC